MKSLESELHEREQKIRQLRESLRKFQASKGTNNNSKLVADVVESYKLIGLSEPEARVAAGVQSAAEHVTESRRRLRDVAKSLGMSDGEAEAFANPPQRHSQGF